MTQRYLDAMSIVSSFGKPDYFLTMTINPKHENILNNLLKGQNARDRHDIVSRVFDLQVKEMMRDLTMIFGVQVAHVAVIEFKKRGLPHIHILLIVIDDFKTTPDMYDRYVFA